MIIIDNSVLSFSFQLDNGIPILPYYDNKDDNELLFLKNYLKKICHFDDILTINRKTIKMQYFYTSAKDQLELNLNNEKNTNNEIPTNLKIKKLISKNSMIKKKQFEDFKR